MLVVIGSRTFTSSTSMPTKNKRISVIVSPEAYAALDELREVSGMAPSNYIRQCVEAQVPIMRKMAAAYKLVLEGNQAGGISALQSLTDELTLGSVQLSLDMQGERKTVSRAKKKRS